MESHRCMDLDDSWVYSTNPRRQPDNLLKYSTLPGRNHDHYRPAADISRRSADDRGKYGTIPGRYLDKAPMRGQSPYRLWSTTRMPQNAVLKDSTNWGSNVPPIHRGSTLEGMDKNTYRQRDSRIREPSHYKWDNDIATIYANEYERKRQRLPGDPYGEIINHAPSSKQRPKGKLIQMDSIYGKWEADYILEKKMKELKYDEWLPLHSLPKALQNQLLAQTSKGEHPEIEKTKSATTSPCNTSQEKRSWWSKLVKSPKSGVANPAPAEPSQDKANTMYMEQSSSINQKQEVLKENRPQLRKRKVPPPYVPPPSYDYPHRIFPVQKEKVSHAGRTSQKPTTQILPLHDNEDCHESREKVPRYSVESTRAARTNVTSSTNKRENRMEEDKKKEFDSDLQSMIQGRKLPRAHGAWIGPNSDEFLDHIYECVEGSSPLTHNVPNFSKPKSDLDLQTDKMIYGTVSFPLQRDTSIPYTLYARDKGRRDEIEATKRKNKTIENSQRHMPPFDVRPPIPRHGVKLPRELGFNYASGDFLNVDKRIRGDNININKQDSEQGREWKRPLRVISNKESKTQGHSKSSTDRTEYGRYSHTLPLKKQYMKPHMQEELKHNDFRKQRVSYQDTDFPRWRETGNMNTLPGRSRDHNHWENPDGLKISKKTSTYERHRDLGRSQAKEIITEKMQPALSNDNEGLFVIDATCVVVKAEYIFPPVMEQVKFVPDEKCKGETLAVRDFSENLTRKEKAPHSSSHSKPSSSLAQHLIPKKSHPKAQYQSQMSPQRESSTLKERAVRILGISIGELDYLNEVRDQHKPNESLTTIHTDQGHRLNTQDPEVSTHNGYNKKESKIRNYKEMPCILEDVDSLPATLATDNDRELLSNSSMCDNGAEENKGLGSEQNVLIPHVQNCSEPSNISVPNDQILATPNPLEGHPAAVNCIGINAYPNVDSDGMEPVTTMNEQPQEGVETIVMEQNREPSPEPLDTQPPETLRQRDGQLFDLVEEEGFAKHKNISTFTEKNTSEENPTILMNDEDHCKPTKHVPDITNPQVCVVPDVAGRQRSSDICLDRTAGTSSPRSTMKAYSRRPNYYAKDLREAVSRIRRHTAPDSDTDEDLEKPSSDSIEQVSEECVTSCSSDTSDSEVTVILCEAEKDEDTLSITEDTASEGMNGYMRDGSSEDSMAAETSPATLYKGEFVEQSKIFPVPELEASYDLNTCIEEILQDLQKTEQEFFSSGEDQNKGSADSGVADLLTGNNLLNPGMDMESSTAE